MKRNYIFIASAFLSVLFLANIQHAFAEGTLIASPGNSITLSTMDIYGKNDNNVNAPSYSKASVDPSAKTIKARAYASLGVPGITPANQTASGFLGSQVYIKQGSVVHAKVRITFNGSYTGVIGSLGVSAGKVVIKGLIGKPAVEPAYDLVYEKAILNTGSGGIPSGNISNTFNASFETCLYTNASYNPKLDVFIAAGQSSTGNVAGVCDNDFYEGSRQVKLNYIKIEVLDSCASSTGGNSGVPGGQGPGGGRTIIPK